MTIQERSLATAVVVALAVGACGAPDQGSPVEDDAADLRRCIDDGNPCTADVRANGRCTHPALADGTSCPQGTCSAGVCVSSGSDGGSGSDAGTGDAAANTGDAGQVGDAAADTGSTVTTCDRTLSPGGDLASALSAAAAGTTICLNSGNYGDVALSGISKSSAVTVRSTTGVGAVVGITLSSSNQLTFQSMTLSNLSWSGNQNTNIKVLSNTFTGQMYIYGNGNGAPQNNVIDGNTFDGIDACDTCWEGRLQIYGGGNLVVSNNHFGNGGQSDGIQVGGYGTTIGPGNVFDSIIYTGGRHVDPIQLYGEVDHEVIVGNYFVNSNDSIMAPDGGANVTVANNAFAGNGSDYWQLMFGSQSNLTFVHNTMANGIGVTIDAKSGMPYSSNVVATDNIMSGMFKLLCNNCSITHNLFYSSSDATGSSNILGIPKYVGGAAPTNWAGFGLTTDSVGYRAALDGTDMGR